MDLLSARMTNESFSTEEVPVQMDAYGERDSREVQEERTICQAFGDSLSLAHKVDAAVSWVVLGLPVPAPEKVISDPLVLKIEVCIGGTLCERVRKSGQERIARTHRRDTVGTGHRGIEGGRLLILYSMQRRNTNRAKDAVPVGLQTAGGKGPGRFS
jgi:hypothetical protein